MKILGMIVMMSLVVAPGCGDKKDDKSATGDKAKPDKADKSSKADKSAKATGPFGDFSAADAAKKFDGAWVCPGAARGLWEAWEIKGDKIKVWDGKAETEQAFAVTSPCTISLTKEANGSKTSRIPRFTWDGDTLVMSSNLGFVKDGMAVACISNKLYTVKDGTCTEHSEMFGKWSQSPAECSISDTEFELKGSRGTKVPRKGDALIGSAPEQCEKLADFDAAKAKLAEKQK